MQVMNTGVMKEDLKLIVFLILALPWALQMYVYV